MTSHIKSRQEKDRKASALLAFTDTLETRLREDLTSPTLVADLQTHINAFPLPASAAALANKHDVLDRRGTQLWNLSTRLRRDDATHDKKTLCLLRVFAVLLLDCAAVQASGGSSSSSSDGGSKKGTGTMTAENGVRLLKVALKAAKFCLDQKQMDACLKVLEKAAGYESELAKVECGVDPDVAEVHGRLRSEYYILRTAHAWKQSRLDLAEHMFSKSNLEPTRLAPDTAEMLADVLFEIGKDLFNKRQYENAVRWLNRAYDVLGERDLEEFDNDALELRLSTMNYLVRALLKLDNEEAKEKARSIVDLMEISYGDKMVISLLRLDILSAEPTLDAEKYYGVVERMVRTIHLTDASFKTIMHHVHKLRTKNTELADKALDRFLDTRLFAHENSEWIEKATITRIWVSVSGSNGDQSVEPLRELLDVVSQNTRTPFGAAATHAAQTLLWKRIEGTYAQSQFAAAEAWCGLALHPLFAKSGELNKAKIARKTILCALARQDHAAARATFFQMSDAGRSAPLTCYLMYKVALREPDPDFAAECLDVVCKQSGRDATLLYACVMEAQQGPDRRQAIHALQKCLEKYDYGAPPGVHLPALLRCTARMLVGELGSGDGVKVKEEVVGELCKLFEGAAAQARKKNGKKGKGEDVGFGQKELDWFARNGYNIALKHCATMQPEHLLRLLEACVKFMTLLQSSTSTSSVHEASHTLGELHGSVVPSAIQTRVDLFTFNDTANQPSINTISTAPTINENLTLRLLLTHYLASSAALVLARSTDSIRSSLSAYASAATHARSFRAILPAHLRAARDLGAAARADLLEKRAQLLRCEMEAMLKARDWDGLEGLWAVAFEAEGGGGEEWFTKHLQMLGDLAILVHAEMGKEQCGRDGDGDGEVVGSVTQQHRKRVLGVLQRIVNLSWQGEQQQRRRDGRNENNNADVAHLARWLRCLFQLSLHLDEGVALQCVEQAAAIASSTTASAHTTAYPLDELEWLATTAFNHAVDFYCAGDDAQCRAWAERALALARCAAADEEKKEEEEEEEEEVEIEDVVGGRAGIRGAGRGRKKKKKKEGRRDGLYALLVAKYSGLRWEG